MNKTEFIENQILAHLYLWSYIQRINLLVILTVTCYRGLSIRVVVCELDWKALLVINCEAETGRSRDETLHFMQVGKKKHFSRSTQAFNTSTLPTSGSTCVVSTVFLSNTHFVWHEYKIVCVPTWSFKQVLIFRTLNMNVLQWQSVCYHTS